MNPSELFAQVDRTLSGQPDLVTLPAPIVRELARYARAARGVLGAWTNPPGEDAVLASDDNIVCVDGGWWDGVALAVAAVMSDEDRAAAAAT